MRENGAQPAEERPLEVQPDWSAQRPTQTNGHHGHAFGVEPPTQAHVLQMVEIVAQHCAPANTQHMAAPGGQPLPQASGPRLPSMVAQSGLQLARPPPQVPYTSHAKALYGSLLNPHFWQILFERGGAQRASVPGTVYGLLTDSRFWDLVFGRVATGWYGSEALPVALHLSIGAVAAGSADEPPTHQQTPSARLQPPDFLPGQTLNLTTSQHGRSESDSRRRRGPA